MQDPPGGIGKSNGRVARKKKEIQRQRKRDISKRIHNGRGARKKKEI